MSEANNSVMNWTKASIGVFTFVGMIYGSIAVMDTRYANAESTTSELARVTTEHRRDYMELRVQFLDNSIKDYKKELLVLRERELSSPNVPQVIHQEREQLRHYYQEQIEQIESQKTILATQAVSVSR